VPKSLRALLWALTLACSATQADSSAEYALASAHPQATEVGAQILEAGGNAFDAAIAVSASLGVVEPYSSGLGGGGFFLLYDAQRDHVTMLDARERAPLAAHHDMYLDTVGNVDRDRALNGPLAAGIPGLAAAWEHLAEHYGRLPLAKTLEPAYRQAKQGIPVDNKLKQFIQHRRETLQRYPASTVFLAESTLNQPDHADTLGQLMTEGAGAFYEGALADVLISGVREAGGIWTHEDLQSYRIIERDPIEIHWGGAHIISTPLPSATGIILAQVLQMLGEDWLQEPDSIAHAHRLIEALRRAYLDRAQYLGDPDHQDIPVDRLTSMEYAKERMADFNLERASDTMVPGAAAPKDGHTTHFSILDAHGNWVSATLSINGLFGSAFVVPNTGILLNNEMDDFSAKPGALNLYGLIGSEANAIAPGKRMLSSMGPTAVYANGRMALLGSPGGSRITTTVLTGILQFMQGADAQTMVSTPRLHHQAVPNVVFAEPEALTPSKISGLEALNHMIETANPWSNMQVVVRDSHNRLQAASDPRGIGRGHVGTLQR